MHGVAGKFISENQLDDTFFIIDLGNVMRMLQVRYLTRNLPHFAQVFQSTGCFAYDQLGLG